MNAYVFHAKRDWSETGNVAIVSSSQDSAEKMYRERYGNDYTLDIYKIEEGLILAACGYDASWFEVEKKICPA